MKLSFGKNIPSLRATRRLNESSRIMQGIFERLSSGQRINRASDDAAGLSVLGNLDAKTKISSQGLRNITDTQSLLSVAEGAIESLIDITVRLEELSTQASNGVLSYSQRQSLDSEAQALAEEYFRVARSTEFYGRNILHENAGTFRTQSGVGIEGSISGSLGGEIGTGEFKVESSTTFGTNQISNLVDFNGDGNLDFLAGKYISLGNGDGNFRLGATLNTSQDSYLFSAIDVDADGDYDISRFYLSDPSGYFGSNVDATMETFLNDGAGNFSDPIVSILENDGYAFYDSSTYLGQFTDVNGDALADLVYLSSRVNSDASVVEFYLHTSLNQGTGSFSPFSQSGTIAASSSSQRLLVGDFDGDTYKDFYLNFGDDTSFIYEFESGVPSYRSSFTSERGAEVADLNGDGLDDIVTIEALATDEVHTYLNQGSFSFSKVDSLAFGEVIGNVTAADFDGDGFMELVVAGGDSGESIAKSLDVDSTGMLLERYSISHSPSFAGGYFYASDTAGDINNDGALDLILHNFVFGGNHALLNQTIQGTAPLVNFSLKTQAEAKQALTQFQNKRNALTLQRSEIGSFQSRLQSAAAVQSNQTRVLTDAADRIRSVDVAEESAHLARRRIQQDILQSILTSANQQPAVVLQLL